MIAKKLHFTLYRKKKFSHRIEKVTIATPYKDPILGKNTVKTTRHGIDHPKNRKLDKCGVFSGWLRWCVVVLGNSGGFVGLESYWNFLGFVLGFFLNKVILPIMLCLKDFFSFPDILSSCPESDPEPFSE